MKKIFSAIVISTAIISAISAQERRPLIIEEMPNACVHQDSTISTLLHHKIYGEEGESVEVQGYRVQVYSSNRQQRAKSEALALEESLHVELTIPVYVTYVPPFWKVRIGNFRTYEEAIDFKNEFVKSHPILLGETYVVRDMITIKQ